jgi:hypothetical protein
MLWTVQRGFWLKINLKHRASFVGACQLSALAVVSSGSSVIAMCISILSSLVVVRFACCGGFRLCVPNV